MLGKVVTLKGNVYIPLISEGVLKVYEYKIQHLVLNRCHFQERNIYVYAFARQQSNIIWYGMSVVVDQRSNLLQCFLAVKFTSGEACVYCCVENDKLKKVIDVESTFINKETDMYLTDGPSLLIIGPGIISVISPKNKIKKTYDLSLYHAEKFHKQECLTFQCFHNQVAVGFDIVLYIFALAGLKSSQKQLTVIASSWIIKEGVCSDQFFFVPTENFLPVKFQLNLTAMQIRFKKPFFLLQALKNDILTEDLPWDNNTTTLCSSKELLIFDKGILIHKCEIPFANASRIIPVNNGILEFETVNIFLESSTDGVCFINFKKEIQEFQFKKKWPAAQHALPGDYRRNGSKQVLLVYDDSFECWQVGCSLLHLYAFSESLSEDTEIPDQHLATTIAALNKRVTIGASAIADAHYKIAQKCAATHDVFNRIISHTSKTVSEENHETCLQSNLLDIIVNEDEEGQMCRKAHTKIEPMALSVISDWKVYLDDQWILGWTLLNTSKGPVTNINMSIIMEDETLEYRQQVFKQDVFAEDISYFDPGETFFSITALKMPLFTVDPIEISCVLSWCMGKTSENHSLFSNEACLPCQQIPVTVSLTLKDLFSKDAYKALPEIQRLLCYRISQEKVSLSIHGETSDLTDFMEVICQSDVNVQKLQQIKDGLIFEEGGSPLKGINMFCESSKSLVDLEVYVRNLSEVALLIQWLHSVLPEDVIILLKEFSDSEKHDLQMSLLKSMKDEVDLLKTFILDPNVDFDSNSSILTDITTQSVEGRKVTLKRGAYLRMRELLVKREFQTDNVAKTISTFQ